MPTDHHVETVETDRHTLVTIPCLSDNYAFLLRDKTSGEVALIDAPEAGPITAELQKRDWKLSQIWLTHHHFDHIDGLPGVLEVNNAQVFGAAADSARLPDLDQSLNEGDRFKLGTLEVQVIDVSGHTIGHIAFFVPDAKVAFTADSLMALGCGRLFEGTPAQMHASLQKTRDWPGDTLICSGHEYTASNAKFALSVDPENTALQSRARDIDAARAADRFTVPSLLSLERATNPFLRCDDPGLRAAIAMPDATDAEVFAEVRKRKDNF